MTTVLVVDDEPNLVDLVRSYLEREGYAVLSAADGPTALDLARTAQPDLVVLDLMLPGLDGVEVCRRLRRFSDAYVVMLTARAEEVDKLVGLAVGVVVLVRWLTASGGGSGTASGPGATAGGESPLDILRRRLAAGEITEEEFERLRRVVEG